MTLFTSPRHDVTSCLAKSQEKRPPIRDGVSASCVYLAEHTQAWSTVYAFLIAKFPQISAKTWQQRIAQQAVFTQEGTPVTLDTPYLAYQKIYYYRELPQETPIPFQHRIIFMNDHLLVVDKPHFLPVNPVGNYVKETLLVRLKQQLNNPDITPIHRLDRETAGVMLFSLNPASRHLYQILFQQRQVQKTYKAIAAYHPDLIFPTEYQSRLVKGNPFFTMQETAGEPNSFTRISRRSVHHHLACYELIPISGKQHQLRVHMAALGIPILNDRFYPQVQQQSQDDFSHPLQLLAAKIQFTDPITRQLVHYTSSLTLQLD